MRNPTHQNSVPPQPTSDNYGRALVSGKIDDSSGVNFPAPPALPDQTLKWTLPILFNLSLPFLCSVKNLAEKTPEYPIVVEADGVKFFPDRMVANRLYDFKAGSAQIVARRNFRGGVDLFEID